MNAYILICQYVYIVSTCTVKFLKCLEHPFLKYCGYAEVNWRSQPLFIILTSLHVF